MNGGTNVQISALATFASVLILWLAGYFLPDLMDSAPEMLGELFTGALIVAAGLLFSPDAGTKLLPGTGTATRSPVVVGILAGLMALLMFSGCNVLQRPQVDSVADAIAVTAADVETTAQTVKRLCGNTRPGGDCARGATLSTDQKESLKNGLQDVLDGLSVANLALATGNAIEAGDSLARTQAILAVLRAELTRLEN